MEIQATNHTIPGAGNLPAVASRLLRQAEQALGAQNSASVAEQRGAVGIQSASNPAAPGIQSRANGIDRTLDATGVSVPGLDGERGQVSTEERQRLVLRPSQVSVEDRLDQVMSLEDVQRLLLVRSPFPEAPGLNRQSDPAPGQLLDFRS